MIKHRNCLVAFITSLCICVAAQSISQSKYLNTQLPIDERVSDLVSRLSLQQKIKLLMYTSTAIDSNGVKVPAYNWWNECLHGVARAGKATVFPQTIGLAATWDTALMYKVSSAISDEARAKYNEFSKHDKRGIYQGLNFWTPNINIFRDPRWGRGMETYGEDPFLTGKMASSFIRGLQGSDPKYFKAIATVKHFAVHSGPEATRHQFNALVSNRDFFETYTPAFKMCIQDGKAYSLMCAYNRFRNEPCCGSSYLLKDLLRKQWGFNGFVVTDCWAVHDFFNKGMHEVVPTPEEAVAMAIKNGVDLECGDAFNALDKAVAKNLVTEQDLDKALERLFTARFKLGLFDQQETIAYSQIPYSVVESEAHKKLALEAAEKSIVLLKNDNNVLPLSKNIKSIAVIGPNADNAEVLLANYHGYPSHIITPLEGLHAAFPNAHVSYAKGCRHAAELPSLETIPAAYLFTDAQCRANGVNASYYNSAYHNGKPAFTRTDKQIDFYWINDVPADNFDRENFSVKWTTYLKAPADGAYAIGMYGYDQYKLFFDDSLLATVNNEHEPQQSYKSIGLQRNKVYKIEVLFTSNKAAPLVKLQWERPDEDLKTAALKIVRESDVVLMFMGLSPQLEGEEMNVKVDGFYRGDRTKLKLPDVQLQLMKEVHALGKPVVLVLVNGSALAINWEKENIAAIVESWYGGQQAGHAIAAVLSGVYNPAGRLPVTFYTSEKQLPPFDDYNMQGRTYRYLTEQPLYTFGYGLSYTKFSYSNLILSPSIVAGDSVQVSVEVQNTGDRDGEEVVQLYVKDLKTTVPVAIQSLKGFKRIFLKKGEKQEVHFLLSPADFSVYDQTDQRIIKPGEFLIYAGGGLPGTIAPIVSKSLQVKGPALPIHN